MKRVAVIDDDAEFSFLVGELIRTEGMEIVECNEETTAVQCLLENRPELVILDIRMREALSGLKVLREIRAHPEISDMPVIVCTAAPPEKLERHLPLEDVILVPKPFELDDFLDAIRRLLARDNQGVRAS